MLIAINKNSSRSLSFCLYKQARPEKYVFFAFKSGVMQITIKAEALKLSKCKFRELNTGQRVFEWKTTLKGVKHVKVANLIKIPTLNGVKNSIPHSL